MHGDAEIGDRERALVHGVGWRLGNRRVTRLQELVRVAAQLNDGRDAAVPYTDRMDDVGILAKALQSWQDVGREWLILLEQVPVGVCVIENDLRMTTVNSFMAEMLGYTKSELTGRSILDINPREHHARTAAAHHAFMTGKQDVYVSDRQWLRQDGTQIWCSLRVVPVGGREGGPPSRLIAISEDITHKKQEALHAARIQHLLLPRDLPRVTGYDFAATCVPAGDVGGDFYDWVERDDGRIDLTLADVMGKGTGAALVMATVRAAMRGAPAATTPVDRVRVAADSISKKITDEGLFVTLFHCRLDVRSGEFEYVDAGHGYVAIRGLDGEFRRLPTRCMPLGVQHAALMTGGHARLDPGEALVIYSDGLVETRERVLRLEDFRTDFDESADAKEVVRRLVDRDPTGRIDDVTVLLVRRAPDGGGRH